MIIAFDNFNLQSGKSGKLFDEYVKKFKKEKGILLRKINYLKSKYKIKNISDVRFRGNDGYNFVLSLWNGERKEYSCHSGAQPYFAGFMYGTTLRPNCFQCDYAKTERIGDITIGDFIGLGKSIPFEYEKENVSFVSASEIIEFCDILFIAIRQLVL